MGLLVKSEIQKYLKKNNVNVASDLYEATEEEVKELLDKATIRAKANGRKTVSKKDI